MIDTKPDYSLDPRKVLGLDPTTNTVIVKHLDRTVAMRFTHPKATALAEALAAWVTRLARELGEAAEEAVLRHVLDGNAPAEVYQAIRDKVEHGRMAVLAATDSLGGAYAKKQRALLASSWFMADGDETRARLAAIRALVVEVERIRQVSPFATRLANSVLEAIILGDWTEAKRAANDFRFTDESEEVQATYGPLWADFVTLAERESDLGIAREVEREIERSSGGVRVRSVVPAPVKPSVPGGIATPPPFATPVNDPKDPKDSGI